MPKQNELSWQNFQTFTELIILKVLEANKDSKKDVERAAGILPAETVLQVLYLIIKTGDYEGYNNKERSFKTVLVLDLPLQG